MTALSLPVHSQMGKCGNISGPGPCPQLQGQPWGRNGCARQGTRLLQHPQPSHSLTHPAAKKTSRTHLQICAVPSTFPMVTSFFNPKERGKGSDKGKGGRKKSLLQIRSQLPQPSCKLGTNCTHLQPPLPARFCVGEAALWRALPAQPRERGVCSFPGQDEGVTTAAAAEAQQHQRERQEGESNPKPTALTIQKGPQ